jgi:hypothetical protein
MYLYKPAAELCRVIKELKEKELFLNQLKNKNSPFSTIKLVEKEVSEIKNTLEKMYVQELNFLMEKKEEFLSLANNEFAESCETIIKTLSTDLDSLMIKSEASA